jgi:hypothetical protein
MSLIIIPYREREEHLKYFIENTYPLIKKYMEGVRIVIIEQTQGKLFNRGKLLNIGINLYNNKFESFITHDVDINPKSETIEKLYNKNVEVDEIMGIYTSGYNTLGGIIKFKKQTIMKINGFPNDIWGWGCEDKALQNRAEFREIKISKNILNNDPERNKHFTIFNDVDDRVRINESMNWFKHYKKFIELSDEDKEKEIMNSGLNNLTFKIEKIEIINDDIKKITVKI